MNPEVYERMAWLEDRHWWFLARRAIVAKMIAGLGLPPQSRILDTGCGTGGNLAMLRNFGEVAATEMDDWAREIAAAKSVASVSFGKLPDVLPYHGPEFDLVTLLDVLEHVQDDQAALKSLNGLLKPSGYLLITVPAYPFLWSGHDEAHHHYRRYRLGELAGKTREAGFDVVYASYFNTFLFPLIAAIRLIGQLLKRNAGSDLSMPSRWLNRLLYTIFASERALLGKVTLPFGVSALLVARKGA